MKNPEFTMYVGPMWSSKTTKLLMHLERYKFQQKSVQLFKPLIDDRYSMNDVVSHAGWRWPATPIKDGTDIYQILTNAQNVHVVAVDEAFMVSGLANVLIWLFRQQINVVVSSLDLSASCEPFNEIEKMLPWATTVEKCHAVCSVCHGQAFYTHKTIQNDNQIMIDVGGSEKYEPRCASCHPKFQDV